MRKAVIIPGYIAIALLHQAVVYQWDGWTEKQRSGGDVIIYSVLATPLWPFTDLAFSLHQVVRETKNVIKEKQRSAELKRQEAATSPGIQYGTVYSQQMSNGLGPMVMPKPPGDCKQIASSANSAYWECK